MRTIFLHPSYPIAWGAWLLFLFFLPFNQFGGIRILSALVLFIHVINIGYTKNRKPTLSVLQIDSSLYKILGGLLVLFCILSSSISPYPTDSFNAIRKDLLIQVVLFLSAITLVKSYKHISISFAVLLAGFISLSIISALEIFREGMSSLLKLEISLRSHNSFFGGYGLISAIYIPLLLGYLHTIKCKGLKFGYFLAMLLALLLTFSYGSRTTLLVLIFIALLFSLVNKYSKLFLTLILTISILFFFYGNIDIGYLNKYKSLFDIKTYTTNQGLSSRFSVWEGAWHIISERPFLGYGYGWKKLAWVINDFGYGAIWGKSYPNIAAYYLQEGVASYGRVNPHNYLLQVLFEIGLLGLGLSLAWWGSIIYILIRQLNTKKKLHKRFAVTLLLPIIAYWMSNLTNGFWVGSIANLAIICAGLVVALNACQKSTEEEIVRDAADKNPHHSPR